jgi:spore maturation protein CgeB
LRIFIPAPCFDDSFVDNVQVTLAAMGHEVRTLGPVPHDRHWNVVRRIAKTALAQVYAHRPPPAERRIVGAARAFKPDIIIGLTAHLHSETLAQLRALCPGRCVLWWGDTPANAHRRDIIDSGWDAVFLKDRAAVAKLRLIGRRAFLLHEAMNPMWHKPVASQAHERLAVAGNYYAFRQELIVRMLRDGVEFDLYGPPPPRWAHREIRDRHLGRYITREEKSLAFGEAMACLNTFNLSEGDSLNCRAFEVAGAGGLQLIEYRPAIEDCFEPGKELLTFTNYETLISNVDKVRNSPHEMRSIRIAAAKRAVAEHTYTNRLTALLDTIAG